LFQYQEISYSFELIISPILPPQGEPQAVIVMGHLTAEMEMLREIAEQVEAAISLAKLYREVEQAILVILPLRMINNN
jgi:hypothetical protein